MNIKRNSFVMAARCLVLILAIGFYPASGCIAEDGVSKIKSINSSKQRYHPVNIRAEDYFDIVGTLHLLEGSRVVIGNSELQLAIGARVSGVKLYDQVGALLKKNGKVKAIILVSDAPH